MLARAYVGVLSREELQGLLTLLARLREATTELVAQQEADLRR